MTRKLVLGIVDRARRAGVKVRGAEGKKVRPFVLPGPRTKAERKPPKPVLRAVPEPAPRRKEDGSFVGTFDLGDRDSRWPLGEVRASDFHYCANPKRAGSPYCEHHAGRAWERVKTTTAEPADGH